MSSVVGSRLETAPRLEAHASASAITNTPWVVLMCKFSDVPDEPKDAAFFEDLFTETGAGKGGMFDYWQDMSGGAVSLAGSEVHGWLPLSLSLTTAQGWTWPGAREDLLRACMQAADAEVDFRNFYGIIACINAAIDSGSAGRVQMPAEGTSKTFGLVNLDPLAWFPTYAAHEMGHGFGLPHSFSGDPVVREYGDGWDIMSAMTFGGRHPQHTDFRFGASGPGLCAAYRDRLGWIASGQAIDLSSFGGGSTIRLSALEGGPPGTRLVRVWLGFSTQYYTVEVRKPTGWDRGIGQAGVLVRLVHDGLSYLRQSASGVYNMQPGDYYIDASENVAISVLGIDAAAGEAIVHIGQPGPNSPLTRVTMMPLANAAGWHNEDVTIELTALSAPGGRVREINFSATGASSVSPTTVPGNNASLRVTNEGLTTVVYSATDISGAGELPAMVEVRLDKTRPATAEVVSSSSPGVIDIELVGSDQPALSGFKSLHYQADGANPIPPTTTSQSQARFSITAPGQTTVFFWSTDNAGNVEGPHSLTFRPSPEVTPTSLAFVALPGNASEPSTLLLRNLGQTALSIAGIETTDQVFEARPGTASPCGPTLDPGATCAIDVVFAPLAAAVYNGSLLITTNASSRPLEVPLTGTGTPARLEFAVPSLAFPPTQIRQTSAALTATIRNPGVVPLIISGLMAGDDFIVAGDACGPFPRTLRPGEACDVDVAFRPRGPGLRAGGLQVSSNVPGGPKLLSLEGEGIAVPGFSAVPPILHFPNQPLGTTTAPVKLALTNTGTSDLRVTGALTGGANSADFAIIGGSCLAGPVVVLNPEGSCELEISFRPAALGTRLAEILVATNVPGPPRPIPLVGEGITAPPVTLDPTSLAFGPQAVGTTGPASTITLTNNDTTPVEIRRVETTGNAAGDFAITSDTCGGSTIPVGGTCAVSVAFSPTEVGSRAGILRFTDGVGEQHDIPLSGTGSGALVTFDPPSVDFGAFPLGGTERQDIAIRNTGNMLLTVTGLSVTGDYRHGQGCASSVSPGSYCTLRVVFQPAGPGPRNGELVVTSDALGSPHRLALTGIGLVPAIGVSANELAFGPQSVGTASPPEPVTISSTGTAPLSIEEVALDGTHPGDFRLQDGCGWRGHQPGSSCTINVVFAPTASGQRTATLTIRDDAPGSPHTVTLTGSAP